MTSADVREALIAALQLDLIGPSAQHALAAEQLSAAQRPSSWYLSGFLSPAGSPPAQIDDDDDDDAGDEPDNDEQPAVRRTARRVRLPSSIGLTCFVDAATRALDVTVNWGDYRLVPGADGNEIWQRTPQTRQLALDLPAATVRGPQSYALADSGGLQLQLVVRSLDGKAGLPAGARSLSLYLVNRRQPATDNPDEQFAFQAEFAVRSRQPFLPRPELSAGRSHDWDELVADLHYRDTPEYAVGHGVAADWQLVDGACRLLRTVWLPGADVEKTVTNRLADVTLAMPALGALATAEAVEQALQPLVTQYRAWIAQQRAALAGLSNERTETAATLLNQAEYAAVRIAKGIALLRDSDEAREAFRVANRAVARALEKRGIAAPAWRAFQLAFILLNLSGIADPQDNDRESVDLLFFPTGGGKTEAYLGLAAFTLVLRRLRNPQNDGRGGAGVGVIMRYTLRLLTLDQLSRAAALICALELEREAAPGRYGSWPFEIGLWVGKGATPNVFGTKKEKSEDSAINRLLEYKKNPTHAPSPIPIEDCPWCGHRLTLNSFTLRPHDAPTELLVTCANSSCEFINDRPLPIVAVDEAIYRRLPAFLIATVDKFAALPWIGPSGALLGGADRSSAQGFYGAAEPKQGNRLAAPLLPPDLIIQDELHLISGPLGTLAGLYETAVDGLMRRDVNYGPKIVASTATVRRAQAQIQALFARDQTDIFPPPGPDRRDSFFALTRPSSEVAARRYLGVAAPGRSTKLVQRRTWLALMGAAELAYQQAAGTSPNPADPYMTVLGYFSNLRELGSTRRILEEEVGPTLKVYSRRKRLNQARSSFADRKRFSDVVELTSRVSTAKVAEARRKLGEPHSKKAGIDTALATNMISVGLDIQRLGLMVVVGQPMLTAEYIQATSRVGRDDTRPGLVVTLLNPHRARDRSHYERFRHYHETFYRAVEAASITPFALRALDRGLVGALVTLARHSDARLTPATGVQRLAEARVGLEARLVKIFRERIAHQPLSDAQEEEEQQHAVQTRITDLLDAWSRLLNAFATKADFSYQRFEPRQRAEFALLAEMLERPITPPERQRFKVGRSLRDVEPEVNVFLRTLNNEEVIND